MKTTSFLLPFLLVIALSTIVSVTLATASPDPVLDVNGKNLRSGINYHVLPFNRGKGGVLTVAKARNKTCPFDVVQEYKEVNSGLPLSFTPVNPKKGVIRQSTDLNIKFSGKMMCTTVWKVEYDQARKQYFVTSGGVEGNPGQKTISNWFKIQKYQNAYKFLYCPTVWKYCKVICKDVGIFIENGMRHLALSDVPFKVMFKKG